MNESTNQHLDIFFDRDNSVSRQRPARRVPATFPRGNGITFVLLCLMTGFISFSCERPDIEKTTSGPKPAEEATSQLQPSAAARGVVETICKRGELRVGMQVGYVPFQMPGPKGSLIGFDVDCAEVTAKALGVGLRIVRLTWEELVPALLEGKIDLIMSGMTVTPERNLEVVFTLPVLETGRMFAVHRKNAERFSRFQDLNRKEVFVVTRNGGLGGLRLNELLPNVGVREFPDSATALAEVIQGRAQAYIDEEFKIRMEAAKRSNDLVGVFTPLTYEPIAWAIRPGDAHWLNWLDNFIRMLHKNGTLEDFRKKWLHDYYLDVVSSIEKR